MQQISQLMSDNYAWACIALVASLSKECDSVGVWCEGCPCPEHQYSIPDRVPGVRRTVASRPPEALNCPFKCCRAPELACGVAMLRQEDQMLQNQIVFNEYVSRAPPDKRSELHNTWSKATSRIWGVSSELMTQDWTRTTKLTVLYRLFVCLNFHFALYTHQECLMPMLGSIQDSYL